MAIIKKAKSIVIKVQSNSTIIVKENLTKTAGKLILRTTESDIEIIAAKRLKVRNNGH